MFHERLQVLSQASADLNAKERLPLQQSKSGLAMHHLKEPLERPEERAATEGMPLLMPRIAAIVVVADGTQSVSWWRRVKWRSACGSAQHG